MQSNVALIIITLISTVNTHIFEGIERKQRVKTKIDGVAPQHSCKFNGWDMLIVLKNYELGRFLKLWSTSNFHLYTKDFRYLSDPYKEAWFNLPKVLQDNYAFHPSSLLYECLRLDKPESHLWSNYDCSMLWICISFYLEGGHLTNDLLTVYWYYYLCYKHIDTYYTCPNPCNSNPCTSQCESYYDPNIELKLTYNAEPFRHMLQMNYRCKCEKDFYWNKTSKTCEQSKNKKCKINCANEGTCVNNRCICPPAFTGEMCEKVMNPCYSVDNRDIVAENCGDLNYCSRDPRSVYGYHCNCGARPGYRFLDKSDGKYDPRCIDIDECKTHYKDRCLNGGTCINAEVHFRVNVKKVSLAHFVKPKLNVY